MWDDNTYYLTQREYLTALQDDGDLWAGQEEGFSPFSGRLFAF